jgi:hypothetical protein
MAATAPIAVAAMEVDPEREAADADAELRLRGSRLTDKCGGDQRTEATRQQKQS